MLSHYFWISTIYVQLYIYISDKHENENALEFNFVIVGSASLDEQCTYIYIHDRIAKIKSRRLKLSLISFYFCFQYLYLIGALIFYPWQFCPSDNGRGDVSGLWCVCGVMLNVQDVLATQWGKPHDNLP